MNNKTEMYKLWYVYMKPNYGEKAYYSFIVYKKTEGIYVDIEKYSILQIMNKTHHYLKEKIKK